MREGRAGELLTFRGKMPTIIVSSAWAEGGQTSFEVSGGLLTEVIKSFTVEYPAYRRRLLDESGEPKAFFNIYVNDVEVPRNQRATTTVNDGSVIMIIPPLAGG
jgi:molybdopterin converting factor small subunit